VKKKNSELDFLSSLEEGKEVTQKNISNKISVSIGFVNALIKKFLKKGIIKVQQAPYKRFVYYLTPEGFSEKSKLVLNYLNDSLSLFRSMRKEFNQLFSENLSCEFIIYGISEISEIAILSANEFNANIIGVIEPKTKKKFYFNIPIIKKIPENSKNLKFLLCSTDNAQEIYFKIAENYHENKIFTVSSLFISRNKPNFKPKKKYGKK
tara:strand:- start:5653 stop:6276 length:624 start_codon:yes stop_codon:yes gene_type:complete